MTDENKTYKLSIEILRLRMDNLVLERKLLEAQLEHRLEIKKMEAAENRNLIIASRIRRRC